MVERRVTAHNSAFCVGDGCPLTDLPLFGQTRRVALAFHLHTADNMSEEQLRTVVASSVYSLVSSAKISAPISAIDLLTTIIATGTPHGLLNSSPTPSFRLTDLPRFERILDWLSNHWDNGSLALSRDDDGLTIMDIHLGSGSKLDAAAIVGAGKKRKRVVDEDADSAAGSGDEADESYEEVKMPVTALGALTKDLKEVYTVLQKSTARGRLLAEQVCLASQ